MTRTVRIALPGSPADVFGGGRPATPRQCGDCSLCCKVMRIDALLKPSGTWCPHAKPGKGGCSIYDHRPGECQTFVCSWRGGHLPENLKPNKVKAVIGSNLDATAMTVHVDPAYPGAAEQQPLKDFIDAVVEAGLPAIIVCGERRRLLSKKRVAIRNPANGEVWISSDQPETTHKEEFFQP